MWRNKIPFEAVVVSGFIAVVFIFLTIELFKKYFQRRKTPALYLALAIFNIQISSLINFVGTTLAYTSSVSYLDFSWTDPTYILAFIFMAIANVFVVTFMTELFFENGILYISFAGILNGITVGLLISNFSVEYGTFNGLTLIQIYHAILTMTIFLILGLLSTREANRNTGIPRIGFIMISYFGYAMMLVFPIFALDPILTNEFPELFSLGYTPMYYMGWILVALSATFGYLGYLMPSWFKNRFSSIK